MLQYDLNTGSYGVIPLQNPEVYDAYNLDNDWLAISHCGSFSLCNCLSGETRYIQLNPAADSVCDIQLLNENLILVLMQSQVVGYDLTSGMIQFQHPIEHSLPIAIWPAK